MFDDMHDDDLSDFFPEDKNIHDEEISRDVDKKSRRMTVSEVNLFETIFYFYSLNNSLHYKKKKNIFLN